MNPVANKIYVSSIDPNSGIGRITVIDGATNSTTSIPVGSYPGTIAINPVTNKIYIATSSSPNGVFPVTVIDGATNATTTVQAAGNALAVNPVTNKIYVAGNSLTVIGTSTCSPPPSARAFVLNATVVPPGSLTYLTLWPDAQPQPLVSTLNALDGAITSNMAIVPTANGLIDAFASNPTQLILDLSGFFAP